MHILLRWLMVVILGAAALLASASDGDTRPLSPVTVYQAKDIVTMEPGYPHAKFVAVSDGLILGLGETLEELEPWTKNRQTQVDRRFAKDVLFPGLIEPHVHPMQAAVMFNNPVLAPDDWDLPAGKFPGARSEADYIRMLKAQITANSDQVFISWGYHELFHGPMGRILLDEIAPDRPVVIWQRSFHDVFLNSAALRHFGIGERAEFDALVASVKADPHHASFERGLFSETALLAILSKLRPIILSPEKMAKGFADLQTTLRRRGITTISDMGTGIFADFETEAALIQRVFERTDNPSRVMLMPVGTALPTDIEGWLAATRTRFAGAKVRVDRRVKFLADGAFFAQNMRMNAPGYSDGHVGKWITEPDIMRIQIPRFWNAGFNLHIHVNGDEGLDVVLKVLESLPPRPSQTITLEHLGFSTEAQNRRIARLSLMVSAQPNYIRVLGDAYGKTGLGSDRAAQMNRLGSLEAKNIPLGLHSDFNMAPIDPLYLAWISATRETIGGHVKAPSERLSLDKALRAITIEAAQVIGMDASVGSIASGKKADFAVLDRNPYTGGAAGLRDIQIKGVIFEGVFVAAE